MKLKIFLFLCFLPFLEIQGFLLSRIIQDTSTCLKQFQDASHKSHPDIGLKIDEVLVRNGYPAEKISVTTDDGYILGVFRIPFGKRSPLVEGQRKKAVFLAHGFFMNAQEFLVQHEDNNLAMLLADSGFDVFLYNSRGTHYSQGHVNPEMPADDPFKPQYWNFGFHEMGIYDFPAVMNAITNITGNEKMSFVGHSMGTTLYFVAMAQIPELNDRIELGVLLAPNAYISHSALAPVTPFAVHSLHLFNIVLGGKVDQPQVFQKFSGIPFGRYCASSAASCGVCGHVMFALFGYDGPQMNYTTLPVVLNSVPDTVSVKTMVHYAQVIQYQKLCQFDYLNPFVNAQKYGEGQFTAPCYDLGRITAPTVIYWGSKDNLATPRDVRKTASELRPTTLKANIRVNSDLFNHLDFAIAKDARTLLYDDVVDRLQNP